MMRISQGQLGGNFTAFLSEGGVLVPGSVRHGHNVLTYTGKRWLSRLVAWEALDGSPDGDVAFDDKVRLRWIGVGTGSGLELPSVNTIQAPVLISGPQYIVPFDDIASPLQWIVPTALLIKHVFAATDLPNGVVVTEAGLFVDRNDGGLHLNPTDSDNAPVFYKAIDPPLPAKSSAQTLTILWEFRH